MFYKSIAAELPLNTQSGKKMMKDPPLCISPFQYTPTSKTKTRWFHQMHWTMTCMESFIKTSTNVLPQSKGFDSWNHWSKLTYWYAWIRNWSIGQESILGFKKKGNEKSRKKPEHCNADAQSTSNFQILPSWCSSSDSGARNKNKKGASPLCLLI